MIRLVLVWRHSREIFLWRGWGGFVSLNATWKSRITDLKPFFLHQIFFRNHYAEMQTCIGRELHRCKNSSDSTTLGKINQIKRVAAASEEYYCSYGGVNPDPFNGKVMQGCRKKAHKKMRKCPSSFHKRFSDDNGSTALCRLDPPLT